MILPDFKIRCSQNSKILGGNIGMSDAQKAKKQEYETRDKPCTDNMIQDYAVIMDARDNPELPAGAKTYCKKWMADSLFKRRKEINSKYLDKGNFCEEWSIEFINKHLLEKNTKNKEQFSNDFMTGEPDIINDGIDDVKNSYDHSTFPLFETEIPNKDYEHQLNGYMHLCNKKTARLIYTLNDMPHHLIEKEARSMAWREGGCWEDYFEQCQNHFTYKDIDPKYKIKIFHLEYQPDLIEEIKSRVDLCRLYIKVKAKDL